MLTKPVRDEWVRRLRSGEYEQCNGVLTTGSAFCCLGVLADQLGLLKDFDAYNALGVASSDRAVLITMNDLRGATFPEIADWIVAHLPTEETPTC